MSASRTMSCARIEAQMPIAQVAAGDLRQDVRPDVLERRRVLVGEPDEADVALAAQPLQLVDELRHVAVAPALPEHPLAAVGAGVRAAARELDDRRPAQAEGAILVPVVDQVPADRVGVEVGDRRPGRVDHDLVPAVRQAMPATPASSRRPDRGHARRRPAPRPARAPSPPPRRAR